MTRQARILMVTSLLVAICVFASVREASAQISVGVSLGHHSHHDYYAHSSRDYLAYRHYQSRINRARVYSYRYGASYPVPASAYYVSPQAAYYAPYGGHGARYAPIPRRNCYRRYDY